MKDLVGNKYGKWTVISFSSVENNKNYYWNCQCECGKSKKVYSSHLTGGRSAGCNSCHISKIKTTHGKSKTPLFGKWQSMISRCHNPNHKQYPDYGARGIIVCEEWSSFVNFHRDMGEPPAGMELDRIDNDKGYYKENCRWTTHSTNMRNQRKRKGSKCPYKGVSQTKSGSWQAKISVNYKQVYLGVYDTAEEAHEVYLDYIGNNL